MYKEVIQKIKSEIVKHDNLNKKESKKEIKDKKDKLPNKKIRRIDEDPKDGIVVLL